MKIISMQPDNYSINLRYNVIQKTKYDVLIVQEPEAEPRVLNP